MATKEYCFADIKKHNDIQSNWIVIHNNVYDVTPFLNEHPGGEEVLLEQGGQDASEAFEDVGHSSDARELMLKYKIGEIVESEKKPVKENTSVNWQAGSEENKNNSLRQWLVPIALGVLASILYRFYFAH